MTKKIRSFSNAGVLPFAFALSNFADLQKKRVYSAFCFQIPAAVWLLKLVMDAADLKLSFHFESIHVGGDKKVLRELISFLVLVLLARVHL